MRKSLQLLLLLVMVALQAAHGAFAGATLCREENGAVALEWAQGGQCEGVGDAPVPCANKAGDTASDHCVACLDIPLPSEESVKSLAIAPQIFFLALSTPLEALLREPVAAALAFAPVPHASTVERLDSIRLRI